MSVLLQITAGTVTGPVKNRGYVSTESARCSQCLDKMLFNWHLCIGGRYLHPEGLPSDYTVSVLFRILPETPQEAFALWEILNKANEPLVGLILDSEYSIWLPAVCVSVTKKLPYAQHQQLFQKPVVAVQKYSHSTEKQYSNCIIRNWFSLLNAFLFSDGGKTLTFFNYDYKGDFQTVTFEGPDIRKIFYGSFHKVSILYPVLYWLQLWQEITATFHCLSLLRFSSWRQEFRDIWGVHESIIGCSGNWHSAFLMSCPVHFCQPL